MSEAAPQAHWRWRWEWTALAAIVLAGGALRLVGLHKVGADPFYDAAVRSMGMSWHNLFFGAFEPGGSVSIDKPPVDLWLQVASVKLFGFGSTSLKLPQALAGTAAVGLLYVPVRRVFGIAAGLAAALALAVMPIEVITSRSDTMDAVMMLLLVLALLCLVRACESGSTPWLLGAAAALGVAFNVKLLESVVALPGLGLIALLGFRRAAAARPGHGSDVMRTRVLPLAAATAVFIAVALSWLSATLLFPAHERPYAIGSTNGSAWNAAFVFNGLDRIEGKALEGTTPSVSSNGAPQNTLSERERIPITPASPTRLLDRIGPLSGERLGLEALMALLLGIPAVALSLRGAPLRRTVGLGLLLWLLTGLVLFSQMTRLHPRYLEGFTPAVAALVGFGIARLAQPRGRIRLLPLAVALVVLLVYAAHLLYGIQPIWWLMAVSAVGAVAFAWFDRVDTGIAAVALALVAVLAIPTRASIRAVRLSTSDAGNVGALPAAELRQLSAYLRAHRGSARYEVAVDSATKAGALIVRDGLPVIVLTTYEARTLTSVENLKQLIARGEVRYALLTGLCGAHTARTNAACSTPALWVRAHATDVSRQAGLAHAQVLWLLPGSNRQPPSAATAAGR